MSETFPCGCPWRHQRVDFVYPEVHTPECRERTRAHARRYRQAAHARFDKLNTVVCSTVPIILEGAPAEPQDDDVDRERPALLPSLDESAAMARVFGTSDRPSAFDWALVCGFWLRRQQQLRDDE